MTIQDLKSTIEAVKRQITPLHAKLTDLNQKLAKAQSVEFISVNRITLADVELSGGPGVPWFGRIDTFALWLKANSTRNWTEWNGRIYRTSDLIAGRMPDMPGTLEDVPR